MDTINIAIPAEWLEGLSPNSDELRQAIHLGLQQLKAQNQPTVVHRQQVWQALVSAGLSQATLNSVPAVPLTEAKRRQLAHRLAGGQALSETIIAERDAR